MRTRKEPDLRKAGNIPKETLDYLAQKRSEDRGRSSLVAIGILVLFLLCFAFLAGRDSGKKATPVTASEQPKAPQSRPTAVIPRNILATCDRDEAGQVLDMATKMAVVQESDSGATYTFRADWWPTVEPKAHQLIEGLQMLTLANTSKLG